MSLTKRILFYAFVTFAAGAACWGYFHLKQTKKPRLLAEEILPDNALCVFSSNSFTEFYSKLSNQNLVWNEVITIKEFRKIHSSVRYFDSIITDNDYLNDFFQKKKIFAAFYSGTSVLNTLILFNLNDLNQENDFLLHLEKIAVARQWTVKIKDGVVALANDASLPEWVFNTKSPHLKDKKEWNALSKLNSENELLSVYLDHSLLNAGKNKKLDLSKCILKGHSVATFEMRPDELSVNGFNLPDSSSLLNLLSSQQAQPCDFFNMLPFNASSFSAFGFHDFSLLRKKLKPIAASFWKVVNDSAMFNAEQEFYNNIGYKLIEVNVKHREQLSKALIVEVKDTASTAELLPFISDTILINQGIKTGVLRCDNGDIISASFGSLFNVNARVGIVYDKYFIVADSSLANEMLITLQSNSGITANESFMSYAKNNLGLDFNYLHYTVPRKNSEKVQEIFPFLGGDDLKHFDKFTDLSLSVANYKNVLQFRLNLKYQQEQNTKEVPGLWTFEADTVLRENAALFSNHKTGENELVISDMQNNLYLLNATGGMLWKKKLGEPVMSEIYTVDAFKNNKFQLLFSTLNYIHLVDRNGKDVEGFPVKLPSTATGPLTVLDYEGTRDYRLFISCEDKRIYNFGITGAKNEKFVPVKTDAVVSLPVKYMKVAGSDYLVTADVEGKIYLFSRRGEGRIDFKNKMTEGCKGFYADASGSLQNSRLIYFDDKNGLLESISLTDKKDVVKLGSDFEDANYYFELVDDDKKTDVILLDKTHLKTYDLGGNEIFAFSGGDSYTGVNYFYDADAAYFILNTGEQVQVLNASSKKFVKKFSASGRPLVSDLFKDGKKYILVPDGRILKCVILK